MSCAPAPLTPGAGGQAAWCKVGRAAATAASEPVRVQCRASAIVVIVICGQKIVLDRTCAGQTPTIAVSDTVMAIGLDDAETRVVRRTTTQPVRSIKGQRPRTATSVS